MAVELEQRKRSWLQRWRPLSQSPLALEAQAVQADLLVSRAATAGSVASDLCSLLVVAVVALELRQVALQAAVADPLRHQPLDRPEVFLLHPATE